MHTPDTNNRGPCLGAATLVPAARAPGRQRPRSAAPHGFLLSPSAPRPPMLSQLLPRCCPVQIIKPSSAMDVYAPPASRRHAATHTRHKPAPRAPQQAPGGAPAAPTCHARRGAARRATSPAWAAPPAREPICARTPACPAPPPFSLFHFPFALVLGTPINGRRPPQRARPALDGARRGRPAAPICPTHSPSPGPPARGAPRRLHQRAPPPPARQMLPLLPPPDGNRV
ncbi:MAG: hypothetical protein J3K34DRAFT_241732 [Monoraphidium minutum]|nr:MAG: hypothetical protein J3K34DRAFT_241732 [Monoraphidium minutum]